MRAPLAPIDDLQFRQWELESCGQRLDAILERAGFKRRELVEERDDEDGVDCDCEHGDGEGEEPQVKEEAVARLLDDLEECVAERDTEGHGKGLALDHVRDP